MKKTKRQILLAALVVALGVAVYLNWAYTRSDTLKTSASDDLTSLSDVLYVGGTNIDGVEGTLTESAEEYFNTARVSRQKTRDEAITVMQNTIATTEDEEVKLTAAQSVLTLADHIETEGRIENLVLAKGFADCMAYVDGDTVSIVVATGSDGLTAAQAAQIHDIAVSETQVSVENIRIIEMK